VTDATLAPALAILVDAPRPSPDHRPVLTRVTSPVFIGRDDEVEALGEALGQASAGEAVTVFVGGEAGIGKTRLMRELVDRARERGAIVLEGGCVSLGTDEALPYAPIASALRALIREVGRDALPELIDDSTSELSRLVPDLGGTPDEGPWLNARPDWAQTRLFEGLLTLLGRLGERAPTLLVLEDLHWADRSTREILAFVARNARHERIAIVATYRTDELHRRHPLRPWLAEMDRLPQVRRLELHRFDREEIRRQLEAILGAPPTPDLLDSIARRSAGNPFFAEELIAAGASVNGAGANGAGANGAGAGAAGGRLPDDLRDVLLARVGWLSDPAQDVLGVAAVSGPTVDHELLAAVADRDEAALTAALREAVEAQLIVPVDLDGQPGYGFRHALVQEAIYDDLLPRERRGWHAGYVAALEGRPIPEGAAGASHLSALAYHASAAHDVRRALRAWIEAARASSRAYAMAEAAAAYERALDLWDAVDPESRPPGIDPIQLLYEASMALIHTGESNRAAEIARQAVDRFDPAENPLRAALLRERLGRARWLAADLTGAIRVLEEAVELLAGTPPSADAARVISGLAGIYMVKDQFSLAAAHARQAVEMARSVGAADVEAYSLNTLGVSVAELGNLDEGIALLRESMTMTRRMERAHDLHRAYANLSTVLQDAGRQAEAVEVAMEGVRWSRQLGMWRLQGAFLEANAASALIELGRWDEAWQMVDVEGDPATEGVGRLNLANTAATLAIWTGRTEIARRLLAGIYDVIQRLRDAQFTGPMYIARATLALQEHDPEAVRRAVDEGLERMADTEDARRRAELLMLGLQAEIERATEARARRRPADEAAARAAGETRLTALRDFTEERADRTDHLALEGSAYRAIAEAEEPGLSGGSDPERWRAALAVWIDVGHPYWIAWCGYRLAEALLAVRGSRAEATEALRAAHAEASRLGAAPLVTSIEVLARLGRIPLEASSAAAGAAAAPEAERPFGLTAREYEVLLQLASGRSNRQIGDELFISESTVGVHVSNILGKLGVANRVEAAAIAARAGLTSAD
jgi:DNA-binding CsgD family transcriptional regulator